MNTAPWKDFAGSEIHEGDVIEHPSGERGKVVCFRVYDDESDRWRVDYGRGDGLSRLCLQIGDKGQAVVVQAAARWSPEVTNALDLNGALLVADSCVADGGDMYRIALKVLAHEYRKLRVERS